MGVSFFEKNVMRCNLGFSLKRCESTVPTPDSEVSTSTMNVFMGSGCLRLGAHVKAVLSRPKAFSASRVHYRHLGPFFSKEWDGDGVETTDESLVES